VDNIIFITDPNPAAILIIKNVSPKTVSPWSYVKPKKCSQKVLHTIRAIGSKLPKKVFQQCYTLKRWQNNFMSEHYSLS